MGLGLRPLWKVNYQAVTASGGGGYGVACSASVGERYNLDSAAAMARNCCCSGEGLPRNCKEQGAVPSSSLPVPY